ncbi:hypothetical protein Misp01_40520 [Microtetraspora sp. NBRC 13810]|nr:peptidase inhibitor family I36 protein [Microtetraspora sp. NBRC 13810]GLW08922.1 hypothetical protein Misp01_40520 [Microtetraspora sp. NBRC 13810]
MWRNIRLFSSAVVAGIVISPVGGPARPAAADVEDCRSGAVCGWSEPAFTGRMIYLSPGAGCVETPFPIRSVANTFGRPGIPAVATVHAGPGCTGPVVARVGQQQSRPVLSPPGLSAYLAW